MKLLEHEGKTLLADAGIAVPTGTTATTPDHAASACARWGRVALKSQVPSGRRGKAGGIAFADGAEAARDAASNLLGREIGGYPVGELLVERSVDIAAELYAAVLNDPGSKGPLVLFSIAGGMDVERAASDGDRMHQLAVDVRTGLTRAEAVRLVKSSGLEATGIDAVVDVLLALYRLYRGLDAELVEINPLAVTTAGEVVALDCKMSLDPAALPRHGELTSGLTGAGDSSGTALEQRGKELGLHYIELDGNVGVLANGAGLTMTTLDAVHHFGGRPANFLEIGGDAYTKATPALRLVLDNPRVGSLLVNFCGAFARTDVMAEGVVTAIEELRPDIEVFFTIHGTGEAEAVRLVQERLGATPYDRMDDAVRAAVRAAEQSPQPTRKAVEQ